MRIWDDNYRRLLYLPGSVAIVQGDFPLVTHYFMIEALGFGTGHAMAWQSMPETGVALAPLAQIVRKKRVTSFFRPATPDIADGVLMRMRALRGLRYDLLRANCEHVCRWAVTNRWESLQVENMHRAFR